jgi:hypothetical protein
MKPHSVEVGAMRMLGARRVFSVTFVVAREFDGDEKEADEAAKAHARLIRAQIAALDVRDR